jgi:hypothetical protein
LGRSGKLHKLGAGGRESRDVARAEGRARIEQNTKIEPSIQSRNVICVSDRRISRKTGRCGQGKRNSKSRSKRAGRATAGAKAIAEA